MRTQSTKLEKEMENMHMLVSGNEKIPEEGMSGYLFKRTSNAFKTWNRRWFWLHDNKLVYRKRTGKGNFRECSSLVLMSFQFKERKTIL